MKPEHKKKLENFNPEIQELYNRITDFDIEKKYPVSGLEAKITGMDILTIQDMYVTEMKKRGAWYQNDATFGIYCRCHN